MKKTTLALLILLLLLIPTFVGISKVGATTSKDLWVSYGLPEDIPRKPMPENFTTEDYLNTTNPYSDYAGIQGALDEVDDPEGNNPLYVLVFGDEEERPVVRSDAVGNWFTWDNWAKWQIERGDEALISNFGIDIRILGFLEWDSDDSKNSMYDRWDELEADTRGYLRQWYDGEWWDNYVDAIIGITAQSTIENIAGLSPHPEYVDQGKICILLKWQSYWADDNLVQHEVSHLYYAPDQPGPQPPAPCCAMSYHTHFWWYILEDGIWWVLMDVSCSFTSYSWCTTCVQTIQQNSGNYAVEGLSFSLREHGVYRPSYNPDIRFLKPSSVVLRIDSYQAGTGSLGAGWAFIVVPRNWLNGKYIRFRWSGYFSYSQPRVIAAAYIYDGEYNRANDADFPEGAGIPTKGAGLLQTLALKNVGGSWGPETVDVLANAAAGTQSKCTIFFLMGDGWIQQRVYLDIDWFQINQAAGGTGRLAGENFDANVVMERTGTYRDYGHISSGEIGP